MPDGNSHIRDGTAVVGQKNVCKCFVYIPVYIFFIFLRRIPSKLFKD